MTERLPGKAANIAGYVSLFAALVAGYRVVMLWLTYRYFWVNAAGAVVVFAILLAIHLVVLPATDATFKKRALGIVVGSLVLMGGFVFILFNLHIS